MKKTVLFIIAFAMVSCMHVHAQVTIQKIKDPHIRAQQDRMVITKWGDFLPKPRNFLGVNMNYHYTMTWSWGAPTQNRRYRSGADIRPLAPTGQQTQRMALNTLLQSTSNRYKQHSDSLARNALSELYHNSGLFSTVDPLWQLYYRNELRNVSDYSLQNATKDLSTKERDYLTETGVISWFDDEMLRLNERLGGALNSDMDRGARVLAYHRIMKEYRQLQLKWDTHINWANTLLGLRDMAKKSHSDLPLEFEDWNTQSDDALMRKIVDAAKKLH